ncbi:MAG: flavodoxin-dependent (E)-4-hydroxy-3-methylbut-2-enyl-diphosphate synthase [Thermoanaerobaculales bacterium]|nr:flavodoxin-dependent (E)-4-hydroxy-3-methylbut-2-enyl-diphosphate synthase [Thermoanaerobaculales bacterium]
MKTRHTTTAVNVGNVTIGGNAPVVVQAMTNTDTADAESTSRQCAELAAAGAELVRITVNTAEAAAAVPEIRRRLDDQSWSTPLIGDFHYNGHLLLRENPECAAALAKYRINPGNVGRGAHRDENFAEICAIAHQHGAAIRIGVNGGSLDPALVTAKMEENATRENPRDSEEVLNECLVESALKSSEAALESGLGADRIVLSAKVSSPPQLIAVYRRLAERTRQPLHLGLTEAGMGVRGLVWSSSAMAILLAEGIGDTIRVSLTPEPDGDRANEVRAACEILQALGLRSFAPSVVACPGCGRTTSSSFQELATRVEDHVRKRLAGWRDTHPGVEDLKLAVMGCIVNGPGEARAADIGISLPGTGEEPRCPVFVDGKQVEILQGTSDEIAEEFLGIVDDYVNRNYPRGD